MKRLKELAEERGLVNKTELCQLLIVEPKVLDGMNPPYHLIPGYTNKLYSYLECYPIVKNHYEEKERTFTFEKKCTHCKATFRYEKTIKCTGRSERGILSKGNKSSYNDKKWCGNCKIEHPPMTNETKEALSEKMTRWWEDLSPQRRAAMRKKSSEKKKQFWDRNPEMKAKLSEEVGDAFTKSWNWYRYQKNKDKLSYW